MTMEASHLPLDPEPAMAGLKKWPEGVLEGRTDLGAGAQEIGKAMAREEVRACKGNGGCSPFMGYRNTSSPFTAPQTSPLPGIIVPLCTRGITRIIDHTP